MVGASPNFMGTLAVRGACSIGLSAISQKYFSLRTNQQSASSTFLSEQISTLVFVETVWQLLEATFYFTICLLYIF
jgi:hypothetical protein